MKKRQVHALEEEKNHNLTALTILLLIKTMKSNFNNQPYSRFIQDLFKIYSGFIPDLFTITLS
jgi:hypothetical protein